MKKRVINLFLLLISIVVCIGLLEITIRIFFPFYAPEGMVMFYTHDDGVVLGPKNSTLRQWIPAGDFNVTVKFNQYGLRDSKDLRLASDNALFVVGDSFSFGHGVEEQERYSNLVESMSAIQVYNISIPTDFDGYVRLVEYAQKQGAHIQHLIIGVCMENDLKNYHANLLIDNSQQTSPYVNKRHERFYQLKQWFVKRSASYNAFANAIHQNHILRRLAVKTGLITENFDALNRSIYSEEILDSSSDKLLELKEKFQIPDITALIIPSRALWTGENRDVEMKVHTTFITKLRERGINVLDILPVLEGRENPLQHYYFEHDAHWNTRGHQKVAEALYRHLQAL
jgi:hypothetical protein